MQQHVLDDPIRWLAVLDDLIEIASQSVHQLRNPAASLFIKTHPKRAVRFN
jgi:hypothetical protein